MIAGIWRSISGSILVAVLFGCGTGTRWEGTWTGSLGLPKTPGVIDPIANSADKIELHISGDGSFELLTESVVKSGRLLVEGTRARLEVEEVLNRPVEPEFRKDYDEITIESTGADTIVFRDGDLAVPGPGRPKAAHATLKRATQPGQNG